MIFYPYWKTDGLLRHIYSLYGKDPTYSLQGISLRENTPEHKDDFMNTCPLVHKTLLLFNNMCYIEIPLRSLKITKNLIVFTVYIIWKSMFDLTVVCRDIVGKTTFLLVYCHSIFINLHFKIPS